MHLYIRDLFWKTIKAMERIHICHWRQSCFISLSLPHFLSSMCRCLQSFRSQNSSMSFLFPECSLQWKWTCNLLNNIGIFYTTIIYASTLGTLASLSYVFALVPISFNRQQNHSWQSWATEFRGEKSSIKTYPKMIFSHIKSPLKFFFKITLWKNNICLNPFIMI